MKLIVTFDDRIRPDSTGVYFKKGFIELLGESNVRHVYPEDLFRLERNEAELFVKIDDGLSCHRFNPKLHPSVYYIIDTHLDLEWRQELAKEGQFDTLCFAQKEGMRQEWHTDNKHWVPLGFDPDYHYAGPKEKKYDICFIGNFHSQHAGTRIDYVDSLFKENQNFFYSNKRFFKEMATKLAESRIVFNKSLNQDINMRVFEGLGSGSCLLTDHIDDMWDLGIQTGEHCLTYKSKEDMIEKARYLLNNPDSREQMAKVGREEALSKHTYKVRCQQILDIVNWNKILEKTKKEVLTNEEYRRA